MHIDSVFEAGQAYVMLSRIQCIDQLYIVDKLSPTKLKYSAAALEELKRLEAMSFNKNPSPWHKENDTSIKIASLNCAGLTPHLRDIRRDEKLLNFKAQTKSAFIPNDKNFLFDGVSKQH